MEFRTEIKIKPSKHLIDYSQRGLLVGSCFAENIALKMKNAKFPALSNPFGVLYNPISIANSLLLLSGEPKITETDLNFRDGIWSNFSFHGSFSSPDMNRSLTKMNESITKGTKALRQSNYVIITFGTSWVYEIANPSKKLAFFSGHGDRVVSNCHKFPEDTFVRRKLSVEEVIDRYDGLLGKVLKDKYVIFTVSPVRHFRDGFEENIRSKAVLLLAIENLVARYKNVAYFPAYEIMNDDLRDYRFYARDMIHPSRVAVDYIWELFTKNFMTPRSINALNKVEEIMKARDHRIFYSGTEQHKKFCNTILDKIKAVKSEYPEIDLREEIDYFSNQ